MEQAFGEPWTEGKYGPFPLDRARQVCGAPARMARAIACVNAMKGIPDPAAFVASHAELLAACKKAREALDRHGLLWLGTTEGG